MSELQIFKNEEFGEIRTIQISKEPYFCMADICKALDIGNISQAKSRLNDDGVITNEVVDALGRKQKANFINEPNMYKLIFQSRKESAVRFTDWVTSEVLPSIRKHGMYATEELLDNPDLLIQVATALKEEREKTKFLTEQVTEQQKAIATMKPKADYLDRILSSKSLVATTQIAKDYGYSAIAFNKILRDLGIQWKVNDQWVLYAKYQGMGYVSSRTINITRNDGRPDVVMQTEWTQKGRLFLYELLKKNDIYPTIEKPMKQLSFVSGE